MAGVIGFLLTIILVILLIWVIFWLLNHAFAEKRECTDLLTKKQWNSEDHKDSKESYSEFKKSVDKDSLCTTSEKNDKEEIKGVIKDWTDFKQTNNFKSATEEQKECLKEHFNLPDKGHKALQGYELEYCGWDED